MIIVPDDRIGLVVKKFALCGNDMRLPDGRIIATRGEAGMQAKPLQKTNAIKAKAASFIKECRFSISKRNNLLYMLHLFYF
jgi:hypothetical protein